MKKVILILSVCFILGGCGIKNAENQNNSDANQAPAQTPTAPPAQQQAKDYSMSTIMPDGTERIEGTYISDKDENTIIVETVGGNREIKINDKVKEHMKLLKIEKGNIILLTVKNQVADSVEKVIS